MHSFIETGGSVYGLGRSYHHGPESADRRGVVVKEFGCCLRRVCPMRLLKKNIQTKFVMSYPAMSVYEFEQFKEEKEVLEYWKNSSIYIICQRPVLFFDEIVPHEETGIIHLKIKQRNKEGELSVKLAPMKDDPDFPDNRFMAEMNFFKKEQQTQHPFMNAAGIKFFNRDRKFIAWLSPERLIYDYLFKNWGFQIEIIGNIEEFLTYFVHYIGQAKNQYIWDRLTGHEKLSKVLAVEHPFIEGEFSPYELSLIFLRLDGTKELFPIENDGSEEIVDFDGNILTQEQFQQAIKETPFNELESFAVNDCEAYLINLFEPKYNKRLYRNYPDIGNGLKQLGFETIIHNCMLFANLITEEATMSITFHELESLETDPE